MRCFVLLALTLPSFAQREQNPRDAGPSGLEAGVARADIAPPVGIAQMNWGAQTHIVASGIDPMGMIATALVLGDGKQRVAMVDIDALFVGEVEDIAARASQLTGIPAPQIRLAATHTHAGPFLTGVKGPVGADLSGHGKTFANYRAALADKIVGVIVEANAKRQPVHVGARKGSGSININRRVRATATALPSVGRNPEGLVDRDLVVVRIDRADGSPLAVLMNFQCHGTVMAWDNQLISPDWIGNARRTVESALPGALALFFQGAAGNQGPVEGFTGDLSVAHRLGAILGHQAAALALETSTVRREPNMEGHVESTAYIAKQPFRVSGPRESTLRFATRIVEVERRKFTAADINEMESLANDSKKRADELRAANDAQRLQMVEARWRRYRDLAAQRKAPAGDGPIPVRIQALRIGEIVIVAMPGEPFAEIGLAVKKASPFAFTLFCGYSSGEGGEYMPIASEYPHGGYEVERTPYGPSAADTVVKAAIDLVKSLQ
ncbi:MAG: hypothetical protein FJW30_11495 [Acidobacteria bacterium]|nr:hypothetical protein [Acidobacteriota bacterium]